MTHPSSHFTGKVVLVTGAGGSIGSEICRKLVGFSVQELRMVSHSEAPLYELEKEIRGNRPNAIGDPYCFAILASVTDGKAMAAACEGVDIVIHAAAHKHVPLCEQNPIEAIQNNVGGTITLAEAASRAGVAQFVLISSDKAVKPSSIMGATKRACELFVTFLSTRSSTKFTTVRFGNVLDSSGSVLPLWREQIRQGKPITLTDKRCTRYFMSIPDAVELTLGAASIPRSGLFVLDMGAPRSLYDMALEIAKNDPRTVYVTGTPSDRILEVGLRPGEKLTEELTYGGESTLTLIPRVLSVREAGGRHILGWNDFSDLLMAAKCRAKQMALEQLWTIVR